MGFSFAVSTDRVEEALRRIGRGSRVQVRG